ncbi:hypothetical protein Pan189_26630 [Stratiformator vulcanicus]|uniref:Uncharacterized protein n=2 Tax=Stratiformator vulcanicus TaxID=2527980 RepID=A0A517R342_9PLAN|nr:hypothetical protein Pan189_26630 [Stratiformator vulcanicus]
MPFRLMVLGREDRDFECPECGCALLLRHDVEGLPSVSAPTEIPAVTQRVAIRDVGISTVAGALQVATYARETLFRITKTLSDPLVIAWGTAGCGAVILGWMVWQIEVNAPPEQTSSDRPPLLASHGHEEGTVTQPPIDVQSKLPKAVISSPEFPSPKEDLSSGPGLAVRDTETDPTPPRFGPSPTETDDFSIANDSSDFASTGSFPTVVYSGFDRARQAVVAPRPTDDTHQRQVDLAEQLALRVARFDTNGPKPFREIRLVISEMAGAPINFDETIDDPELLLEGTVNLMATDSSLKEILSRAASQMNMRIEFRGVEIVLYENDATGERLSPE